MPEPAKKSRALPEDGVVRYAGLSPGRYALVLVAAGLGSTRDEVTLSSDSSDADVVVRTFAVDVWRLSGRTHLRSGEPVSAAVAATEFVNGLGEGSIAEASSGADGRYEIAIISVAGRAVQVHAESHEPRGEGRSKMIPLKESETTIDGADVLVETGGVESS